MTTTLNTQKGNILLVEVPMEAKDFLVEKVDSETLLSYWNGENLDPTVHVIENGASLIGTITNGKADFDVELYVEKDMFIVYGEPTYKDYTDGHYSIWMSTQDSFNSLCASQGIEVKDKKWVVLK